MAALRYGIFILALGLVGSSQVSAGELQSVYVAPGGVYIASAKVHVGAGNGNPTYGAPGAAYYGPYDTPTYAPGYVLPGLLYRVPAFYEEYRSAYATRPAYIDDCRRGRLPLCRTATGGFVDQPMVGRDTVTDTCCDKERFGSEPFLCAAG